MDESARLGLKPDTSRGFSPTTRPNPIITELVAEVTRLDERIAGHHIHSAWLNGLRREAYIANAQASAAIEGNTLSLGEAQDVLRRRETKRLRRPNPEEREILQHYRYFEDLRQVSIREPVDLDIEEIRTTHRRLLTGVLDDQHMPGELREAGSNAYVSVGQMECTPPDRVRAELEALKNWYYSEGLSLDTPTRVAVWFHEFESIHPFRDGNGRTGRALTHRLLYTDGLSNNMFVALDQPFSNDRRAYYEALSSAQSTWRYENWIEYFLRCLVDAYQASMRKLAALASVPSGLPPAQRKIVEYLFRSGRMEFMAGDLVLQIGAYKPITISTALSALAKQGYVTHNDGRGRGSRYSVGPEIQKALASLPVRRGVEK